MGGRSAFSRGRDADAEVYAAIGRTMRVDELARHMIAISSNLASNLLLDVVGLESAHHTLARLAVKGIELRRGVEDDRAFEAGYNNRVTPDGMVELFRALRDGGFSAESKDAMLAILLDQQFTGGIAPALPDVIRPGVRIAHKTGDISTVSHDAGFVFLPGRPPYVVAVLVEASGDAERRVGALVAASRAIYDAVTSTGEAHAADRG